MNTFDESSEAVTQCAYGKGRKRIRDESKYKRQIAKKRRHSGSQVISALGCNHSNEDRYGKYCKAHKLTAEDLAYNHRSLYKTHIKTEQDAKLLKLMTVTKVKRRRQKNENTKKRDIDVKYQLLTTNVPVTLPVCKSTFMKVTGVSKDRICRIARYYAEHSEAMPERRGGCRNDERYTKQRDCVSTHIKSFKCRASHYGRSDSGRKYLPNDLSVRKMYDMFKAQNHEQLSFHLYYSVFRYHFNLGFGRPSTDVCADCVKFRFTAKDLNLTDDEQRDNAALFLLHRRRARVFYDLMGLAVERSVTLCFDMMQNIAFPKSPIGQTYYSRQLYMYVFGVVQHFGKKSCQGTENVHIYVWMEHDNRKNSNMIASALDDVLRHRIDMSNANTVRLFSDSCYGQNKNYSLVTMLSSFINQRFPRIEIEHTFPVRGHSFLPADRVFGRIEQEMRKHDTMLLPRECTDLLSNHGNVHLYNTDWHSYDYKNEATKYIVGKKSFKISEVKSIRYKGSKVGIKTTYSGEFCEHSVLKRGKKWSTFTPPPLPSVSTVKDAKKKDVKNLLKAIGAPADVVAYYDAAFAAPSVSVESVLIGT